MQIIYTIIYIIYNKYIKIIYIIKNILLFLIELSIFRLYHHYEKVFHTRVIILIACQYHSQ